MTIKITIHAQPNVTPERAARAYLNSLDAEDIAVRPHYSDAIATGTIDGTGYEVYATRDTRPAAESDAVRQTFPETPKTVDANRHAAANAVWAELVAARLAWRDYAGTRLVTDADGQPAYHPEALPLVERIWAAEAARDGARRAIAHKH